MSSPTRIPLAQLHADETYQPRANGLEPAHVQLLAASDPETWPALLVSPNGQGGYDIIDGFHRHAAAQRLGLADLLCVIAPGAGYPEGVEANSQHGLPLSLEDRRDYARWLASEEPELSYREIGRRCGLHHETVKATLTGVPKRRAATASAETDPIERLVRQVDRLYHDGYGRSWFGLGKSGDARAFRDALLRLPDDRQPEAAKALAAFGQACLTAASDFTMP